MLSTSSAACAQAFSRKRGKRWDESRETRAQSNGREPCLSCTMSTMPHPSSACRRIRTIPGGRGSRIRTRLSSSRISNSCIASTPKLVPPLHLHLLFGDVLFVHLFYPEMFRNHIRLRLGSGASNGHLSLVSRTVFVFLGYMFDPNLTIIESMPTLFSQ